MPFTRSRPVRILLVALCLSIGCGPSIHRAPVLVAESAIATTKTIRELSRAAAQLEQAAVLPTATALSVQKQLLSLTDRMDQLAGVLETIDKAQQAGEPIADPVEKAIAMLQAISPDLSIILAGVPLAPTTQALIDLVRAAQQSVNTVLLEVAKLRPPTVGWLTPTVAERS